MARLLLCLLLAMPLSAQSADPEADLELYALHCSPCHGAFGAGDGPAGRFLDPPPRDLRSGALHFVSGSRGRATDADLHRVLEEGLPGTAMVAYDHLDRPTREAIVRVLRRFEREGAESRIAETESDPEARAEWLARELDPGPRFPVPERPTGDRLLEAGRGRLHFTRFCARCHGPEGGGDPPVVPVDSDGAPIHARDLSRGVLKGPASAEELFRRVRLGIPAAGMPAVGEETLSDTEVWELVSWLETRIPPRARELHTVRVQTLEVPRWKGKLPTALDDPRLLAAPPVPLALAPFRARDPRVGGLVLRLFHDGRHLIVHARWPDPFRDVPASGRPAAPDGLALRLTRRTDPPILPIPGLPLPLDRALWLAGEMPPDDAPVFGGKEAPFENPDRVCISPIGPELTGEGQWRDGAWTALMIIQPDRAGRLEDEGTISLSAAAFDGAAARGPLPVVFSHWHPLRLAP